MGEMRAVLTRVRSTYHLVFHLPTEYWLCLALKFFSLKSMLVTRHPSLSMEKAAMDIMPVPILRVSSFVILCIHKNYRIS